MCIHILVICAHTCCVYLHFCSCICIHIQNTPYKPTKSLDFAFCFYKYITRTSYYVQCTFAKHMQIAEKFYKLFCALHLHYKLQISVHRHTQPNNFLTFCSIIVQHKNSGVLVVTIFCTSVTFYVHT